MFLAPYVRVYYMKEFDKCQKNAIAFICLFFYYSSVFIAYILLQSLWFLFL